MKTPLSRVQKQSMTCLPSVVTLAYIVQLVMGLFQSWPFLRAGVQRRVVVRLLSGWERLDDLLGCPEGVFMH